MSNKSKIDFIEGDEVVFGETSHIVRVSQSGTGSPERIPLPTTITATENYVILELLKHYAKQRGLSKVIFSETLLNQIQEDLSAKFLTQTPPVPKFKLDLGAQ